MTPRRRRRHRAAPRGRPRRVSGSIRGVTTSPPSSCVKTSPDSHSGPATTDSVAFGARRLRADRKEISCHEPYMLGRTRSLKPASSKHEVVGAGILDRADLGQELATFGHQEAAGLDLQAHGMAQVRLRSLARRVPQLEIGSVSTCSPSTRYGMGRPPPAEMASRSCPKRLTCATMASHTCLRCSKSAPEPMCMCRPTSFSPKVFDAGARASLRDSRARCRVWSFRHRCWSCGCGRARNRD
jgi:hypothetical protein